MRNRRLQMRRPYGMQLSDEAMIEIGRVRERLMDYKRSIQPYPVEPEAEVPEPKVVEHLHFNVPQQGYVRYLENKVTESRQRKPKPSGYKGIK